MISRANRARFLAFAAGTAIALTACSSPGATGADPTVVASSAPAAATTAQPSFVPTPPIGPGAPASPQRPVVSPPVGRIPVSPSPAAITGEVPEAFVARTRALLATSVGTDAAALATIVTGRQATWPDGSLGCPKPGMVYTQAIVQGYQLVFDVAGATYDYRLTASGNAVLCEPGLRLAP
jgi:hypothetical protein